MKRFGESQIGKRVKTNPLFDKLVAMSLTEMGTIAIWQLTHRLARLKPRKEARKGDLEW